MAPCPADSMVPSLTPHCVSCSMSGVEGDQDAQGTMFPFKALPVFLHYESIHGPSSEVLSASYFLIPQHSLLHL